MAISNSTISGNQATAGDGGGVRNAGSTTLTLTNVTIANNVSGTGRSGGIVNASAPILFSNTILSNQVNCFGSTSPTSNGHNLSSDNSCSFNATGDQNNTDPKLGPLANNGGPTQTHALLVGSPAIDTGDDAVLGPPHNLTTDQRGEPRKSGIHVDIGAYELQADAAQSSPFTVTKTGDTEDGLCGTLDCSLREAIASGDSGDTIVVPAGTYTLSLGTELVINASLTLTGNGSGNTIIQAATSTGAATSRVLRIDTGDVTISGVTIRHGKAEAAGGNCPAGEPADKDPENSGGGIHNTATLTLTTVVIADNKARCLGAGIYNTGRLTLEDSTVSSNILNGNSAGAGIANWGGTATINRSTISGNNVGGGPSTQST